MSDAEIEETFLARARGACTLASPDDVAAFAYRELREVFAIPTLGYSQRVPPMATSVPGVHLVTSAQIVNGTLNVNETVRTGRTRGPSPAVTSARDLNANRSSRQ